MRLLPVGGSRTVAKFLESSGLFCVGRGRKKVRLVWSLGYLDFEVSFGGTGNFFIDFRVVVDCFQDKASSSIVVRNGDEWLQTGKLYDFCRLENRIIWML